MRSLMFILACAAVAGCSPEDHRAQINLGDEVFVSLVVSPMFSLQSDWHRKLVIETPTSNFEIDLSADTGWWRGSNLYRHSSGVYVLHEGQSGCVLFRTAPPELVTNSTISCKKNDQIVDDDVAQADIPMKKFPASRFYTDLQYIGQFVETPQSQEAISFIGGQELPEAEPPDIL